MSAAREVSHLAAWLLVALVVVALLLVVLGALRVVRRLGPLKRRIDAYKDLPLVRALDETQARVMRTQGAYETELPALVERMHAAVAAMQIALESLRTALGPVWMAFIYAGAAVDTIFSFLGRSPKRSRSRGS